MILPTSFLSDDGAMVDDSTIWELTASLDRLGSGVTRTVFALDQYTVLKVCRTSDSWAGSNLSEAAAWEQITGTDAAQHFAAVYAMSSDGSWMVAERARCTANDVDDLDWDDEIADPYYAHRACRELNIGDMHEGNWGYREDGSIIVIDYALNSSVRDHMGQGGAIPLHCSSRGGCGCSGCYSARCSCQEHDCGYCFPEGDPCDTWTGCHETACQMSHHGGLDDWHPAVTYRRTMFGFVVNERKVCRAHALPKPAPYRNELAGQLIAFATLYRGDGVQQHRLVDIDGVILPNTAELALDAAVAALMPAVWGDPLGRIILEAEAMGLIS